MIDCGATYLILPTAQLDFYAGFGLNAPATDFMAGAGFSFLL